MNSPPSPPRRRRISVAIAALLLVLAVSWWCWPTGDARFVGKWEMTDDDVLPLRRSLQLLANGTSRNTLVDEAGIIVDSSSWDWEVRGDVLELTYVPPPDPTVPGLVRGVRQLHDLLLNAKSDPPTRFRIVRCDENRISLTTIPVLAGYEPKDVALSRIRNAPK